MEEGCGGWWSGCQILPLSKEGSQGKSYYLNGRPQFILFVPELGKFLYVFLGVCCGAVCFCCCCCCFLGVGGGDMRVQILPV